MTQRLPPLEETVGETHRSNLQTGGGLKWSGLFGFFVHIHAVPRNSSNVPQLVGLNTARLVRKEERACLNETPIEIEETKETKARP